MSKKIIFGVMETVKVTTSQHVDIDYPVAGLGERTAAHLIDTALFVALYFVFAFSAVAGGIIIDRNPTIFLVIIIAYFATYVFYNLFCEIFFNGQSIGKRLLKIKVISLDGAQASIGQYFIRWVFRIIDFTLSANLLGFICVAVTEQKQRIGDMVAGTTVIKTKPATQIAHVAFHPIEEEYTPVFANVNMMSDRDVELIHEVVRTYYITYNAQLIYQMAAKVAEFLTVNIPEGMNEMQFLKTVSSDYIYTTSRAV